MEQYKLSIVAAVYNLEKYLPRCLDALVNQTLQEIEILLVNDGSKDNSEQIAKEYCEKYPEKIIYLEKENGGLSDARNYAIPQAKGEYIAFLDSDDYVELDMYEKMYKLAKEDNSDMVECDFFWEYPNKQKEDIGKIYQGTHEMLEKIRVVAWNKLIKKEILKKTKRSEKIVDIKPNIYHIETDIAAFYDDTKNEYGRLEIDTSFYKPVIYCQLTAGSVVNIKPELVLEAVMQMNGFEYNPLDYQIHRLEMYADETAKKGEVHLLGSEIPCKLVPLSEFGKQEMA